MLLTDLIKVYVVQRLKGIVSDSNTFLVARLTFNVAEVIATSKSVAVVAVAVIVAAKVVLEGILIEACAEILIKLGTISKAAAILRNVEALPLREGI